MNLPTLPAILVERLRKPERKPKWIHQGKELIILTGVMERDELVDVHNGHISSSTRSHPNVDNIEKFVVWHSDSLGLFAGADNPHESTHLRNDPCVISRLELAYLHHDPDRVHAWFDGKISIDTAAEIADLLNRKLAELLDSE